MLFKDRKNAGEQLCPLLTQYKDGDLVVYAIPKGGIIVAAPIAKHLRAPMDLLFAHKIGHPLFPEYAIAAVSESGLMIVGSHELQHVNQEWLESQKEKQLEEIKLKHQKYLGKRTPIPINNKTAIIVDDGIATGLTLQAGIKELQNQHPKKIVIAVPIAPKTAADFFQSIVDGFVAIEIPDNHEFFGSIGAYYDDFSQVEDEQVIDILNQYKEKP